MSWIAEFKKPFNIFTVVLSIAVSAFFYFKSIKTKSITYHLSEPASLIYDTENTTSAIKVVDKDGAPIDDDIYLLTGVIWNSGELPISNEDVRKKLTLNLSPAIKILDFKILKQTDPDIAQFNLAKLNNTSLGLSWKYFDPGYAIKFQIIYSASDNAKFTLSGKVLDIASFNNIDSPNVAAGIVKIVLVVLFSIIMLLILRLFEKLIQGKTLILRLASTILMFTLIGLLAFLVHYAIFDDSIPFIKT